MTAYNSQDITVVNVFHDKKHYFPAGMQHSDYLMAD